MKQFEKNKGLYPELRVSLGSVLNQAVSQNPKTVEEIYTLVSEHVFDFLVTLQRRKEREMTEELSRSRAMFEALDRILSICVAAGTEIEPNVEASTLGLNSVIKHVEKLAEMKSKSDEEGEVHIHHHWHQPVIVEQVGKVFHSVPYKEVQEQSLSDLLENNLWQTKSKNSGE